MYDHDATECGSGAGQLRPVVSLLRSMHKALKTLSLRIALAFVTGLSLPVFRVSPTLASASSTHAERQLTAELTTLAQGDVNNGIARRTELIIQLYKNETPGLTALMIRRIYDDAYSQQFKQNKDRERELLVAIPMFGLVIIGLIGALIKQRKLKVQKVTVNVPFNIGQLEFETVETTRNAAWVLYVEMTTRVATQRLQDDQGILREALDSLYKIFEITREILKEAGPDVGASPKSVGGIATAVLNQGLRPFLSKWHPKLEKYEAQRPQGRSIKKHEQQWPDGPQMRQELQLLTRQLEQYTQALAKMAGVHFF